jgi:hypothetical protein
VPLKAQSRDQVMSPIVLVFGRRLRETFRRLNWPASKKRQGTKSREVGHAILLAPRKRQQQLQQRGGSAYGLVDA